MELIGFYTDKGRTLAAKLHAGEQLTITKVTAGDGSTGQNAAVLAQEQQILGMGIMLRSGATVTLPATLAEVEAKNSYMLREVGVYANDPEEGEILFRIYRPDTDIPVAANGQMVIRMYLQTTISEDVTVTVQGNAEGLLCYEDLVALRGAANGLAALDGNGIIPEAQIPALAAAKITSGTFSADRIPSLAAGKITSGTFDAARIPTLAASKVTTGTFAATGVVAKTGTDYTTQRIRNIAANTTAMTASSTALTSGNVYLQYE